MLNLKRGHTRRSGTAVSRDYYLGGICYQRKPPLLQRYHRNQPLVLRRTRAPSFTPRSYRMAFLDCAILQ